ncbi:MAG TPA: glycosyltransferase [Vicinamibacterales bacterium]|nr:glycosyltransferase [Vicinamibacterales bacterium]
MVPTRGRPDLLARCLAALARQRFDPARYEVVVVDDGPDDQTRRVVEAAAATSAAPMRYLAGPGAQGPAAARNAGWRAARAPSIAFTDDDCVPARSWLAAGLDALNTGVDGACGQVIVPISDAPTDHERDVAGLQQSEFVTANCFYRREALEAVGGFDPRFRIAWREDSDVFFGMLERGFRLVYAPGALVLHPVRPAPWGISLRQQRKNLFNALLFRKHPRLYRQRIQGLPPLRYYVTVALLAASIVAALSGFAALAAVGLSAWAISTAAFSMRRLRGASHRAGHVTEMIVTSALIPPVAIFWRLLGAVRFRVPFL